jgi:hypothetical protein
MTVMLMHPLMLVFALGETANFMLNVELLEFKFLFFLL